MPAASAADAQAPTAPAAQAGAPSTTTAGWNLRWRRSPKVTPEPVHVPQQDVFAQPGRQAAAPLSQVAGRRQVSAAGFAAEAPAVQPRSTSRQALAPLPAQHPVQPASPIQQVAHLSQTAPQVSAPVHNPLRQASHVVPVDHQAPIGNYYRADGTVAAQPTATAGGRSDSSAAPVAQAKDFFNNPFSEKPVAAQAEPQARMALLAPQQAQTDSAPGMNLPDPTASGATNGLQADAQPLSEGPATEKLGLPPQTPVPDASAGEPPTQDSMRGLLNDPSLQPPTEPETPDAAPADYDAEKSTQPDMKMTQPGTQPLGSPSDLNGDSIPFEGNPFNEGRDQRAPLNGPNGVSDTSMLEVNGLSCDDFRDRIANATIDTISLDPSPPFRPDLVEPNLYMKQRKRFRSRQTQRAWTDTEGNVLAEGKLIELAYEQAIVETEDGQELEVPINRLSEGDLGYLSENWGLPRECLIEQVAFTPRSWTPLTMSWKASNLCSKPRYYEEVNLERYGHTAGPWLQPVVSSAHFFVNIAVTPYKMGVHGPAECQYALGYYRPGNCAPWIVPPVPISARGALYQAAAVSGAVLLIP